MHNIGKLKIWNASIDLCVEVYESVVNIPNDERYGLSSQIKRSAVSIPSNIAEGAGRDSSPQFNQCSKYCVWFILRTPDSTHNF